VCEPIFQKPLSEISFGHVLVQLFHTARRFNMEIQPQLVLLQKTLLNIEGLGRQLYPNLDLWQTAKPFLERWMSEQFGARGWARSIRRNAIQWAELVPELPSLAHRLLKEHQLNENALRAHQDMRRLQHEVSRTNRRTFRAITGSTFIISAVLIFTTFSEDVLYFGPVPVAAWMLGALGTLILILAWPGRD
jgi:ubiquinone biosynthesis protein